MDSKTNVDQLRVAGRSSCKIINKYDYSVHMETEDIVHLPLSPSVVDNGGFALSPITLDSGKESSELVSCFTSPLTLPGFCMNEKNDGSPRTLKDGAFDLFAAGPDKQMLAPLTTKYLKESRSYAARRLNFNSVKAQHECEKPLEDDMLLEAVYDSLLQCIMSDILGDIPAVVSNPDVPRTPRFAPHLTGITEICPGPPMKPAKKSRNIDLSLCRKLEFDFEV